MTRYASFIACFKAVTISLIYLSMMFWNQSSVATELQEDWTPLMSSLSGQRLRVGDEGAPNPATVIKLPPVLNPEGAWVRVYARSESRTAGLGIFLIALKSEKTLTRTKATMCRPSFSSEMTQTVCQAWLWVPPGSEALRVGVFVDNHATGVDDILVEIRKGPTTDTHVAQFDRVISLVKNNYYRSSEVDWDRVSQSLKHFRYAPSDAEIEGPMAEALIRLLPGSEHSFVIRSDAFLLPQPSGALPTCSRIGANAAVFALPYTGFSPDEHARYLDAAAKCVDLLRDLSAVKIYVDLVDSTGGNASVMLAAISPLLAEGVLIQYSNPEGISYPVHLKSDGVYVADRFDQPSRRPPASLKPTSVTVLMNNLTASAAEITAAVLMRTAAATTAGAATAGRLSANEAIQINQDFVLVLTSGLVKFSDGQYTGLSIQPRIPLAGPTAADMIDQLMIVK